MIDPEDLNHPDNCNCEQSMALVERLKKEREENLLLRD